MKPSHQLALAVTWLLLSGCTTPYKTPEMAGTEGTQHFLGLADGLQSDRPLDVLLIHGMCTHGKVWANDAAARIYRALGGGPSEVELASTKVIGTAVELHQQTLSTRHGALRVNAIVWSPLTTPFKKQLCYDQSNRAAYCGPNEAPKPYPYRRAKLNQLLKDTILNDCLSDAMAYQGRSQQAISRQIQMAVVQALGTSGGMSSPTTMPLMTKQLELANAQGVPLVLISESLGSKVIFDALLELMKNTNGDVKRASEQAFDRVSQIFMVANQLPILALADQSIDADQVGATAATPKSALGQLLDERALRRAAAQPKSEPKVWSPPPMPTVVAFTDPNDLLSYSLTSSPHRQQEGYPVVDVIVSNAPSILGLVEMPDAAHTGYLENSAVKRLISCGNPTSSKCQ